MAKYALITGASRGIGRACAIELAKQGLNIIINYCSRDDLAEDVKNTVVEYGVVAELLKFDVSDSAQIEAAIENWELTHPDDYIDVLVNNAGIRRDSLLIFMQNQQWHEVLNTTLNGFFI